jgi:cytochrome c oxidase subunit 2
MHPPTPAPPRRSPADAAAVVGIWLVLTAVGEVLVWNLSIFPTRGAREAEIADRAFVVLARLAVPVFAFVVAMLLYSALRFRSRGRPEGLGAPIWGSRRAYVPWLAVTGALATLLIVDPGLTGLAEFRGSPRADLVVRLVGSQWSWLVRYPQEGDVSSLDELVLPVGRRIRFEVTSTDVIHSLWIPAFRVKIDAVPGRTTVVYATPTRTGSFHTDPTYRLQCAELCGLGHPSMRLPVEVVSEDDFRAFIDELRTGSAGG